MFFKIGALKNFAILMQPDKCYYNDRFLSQNAGIVILCHRSVFIFKGQVYPLAHFSNVL